MRKGRGIFYLCRILAALFAVFALSSAAFAAAEKVVAQVGDTLITEADLQDALEQYMPSGGFHAGIDRSAKDEYRLAALNDLIEIELLSREARKRGITASDEAVEAVLQNNIKRFGSQEKMNKAMQTRGLTLDSLRDKIRKNNMVAVLLKELNAKSAYSDEEVRKYYEGNRSKYKKPDAVFLYHILIKVGPSAPEALWQEKQKFAEELLQKIRGGADFGSIAYQYSEDQYKYKSGELGLVHRGRLTPRELEDLAFGLRPGEVSEVLRTIHGFHILKVGERMPGETKEFEEVKDKIRKELDTKRFEEAKKVLLEKLSKEYSVKKMLGLHNSNDGK